MTPIADATVEQLRGIRAVLTDIDDTLTLHGKLPAIALQAMEQLQESGLLVIPVTGRPAGWCDHIARMWPVAAVVGENGAFTFRYDGTTKKMIRDYAQDAKTRSDNTRKLFTLADGVLKEFPGTAIASDQAYREIDVAIDFCEDVEALPLATAQQIARRFEQAGAVAKVSSIHVNAWFGAHDKLTAAKQLLNASFGFSENELPAAIAYCGDSPNDAPMFGFFPLSVGVSNVLPYISIMDHAPQFVTMAEGGLGFAEFAALLLAARGK